jgi:hypothetical protein
MASSAALSPAWLGLVAAVSFGGLVLASFASGYHLAEGNAAPGAAAGPVLAARTATVRQHLDAERAVLLDSPQGRKVLARLPADQTVTVRAREGRWARIEYRRGGADFTGWTEAANLSF